MSYPLILLIDILATSLSLWIAGVAIPVPLSLTEIASASVLSAVISVIPVAGPALSWVLLFILLRVYSGADFWPDLLVLVTVGRLVAIILYLVLGKLQED